MTQDLVIKTRQDDILPFWKKLPFFFLFPFRPSPLVLLACLMLAGVVAGFGLGPFGLLFKGILVFLGLRYGFNVLDLFAQGRFEGESPDHTLWNSDRRPAKFGLVIALFIVLSSLLASALVEFRLLRDPAAQEAVIERYHAMNAANGTTPAARIDALRRQAGLPPTAASAAAPTP